jgi:hypothetical protein
VFNGLVGYDAAFLRRRTLLRAVYLDLDEQFAPEFDGDDTDVPRRGFLARLRRREG